MNDVNSSGSSKKILLWTAGAGLLLLVVGLLAWAIYATVKPNCKKCNVEPEPEPDIKGSKLWLSKKEKDEDDYTYPSAEKYCKDHKARLATALELVQANNQGFEYCQPGWLNHSIAGWVMKNDGTGDPDDKCNNGQYVKGCNCIYVYDPNNVEKLGSYCIGKELPTGDTSVKTSHVYT